MTPPPARETFYDDAWYDERWRSLSDDQRSRASAMVAAALDDETKARVTAKYAEHGPHFWIHHLIDLDPETQDDAFAAGLVAAQQTTMSGHHIFGTSIRNLLRNGNFGYRGIRDEELPPAPYEDGSLQRNWDDFYVQAIEAAVGLRD